VVGRDKIEKAVLHALKHVKGAEADIVAVDTDVKLARFSNSEIHQNSVLSDTDFTVRVARGQKVGIVRTNDMNSLTSAIDKAFDIAGELPDSPNYAGLPGPAEYLKANSYSSRTAEFSPADIAYAAGMAIKRAKAAHVTASGTVRTSEVGTLVANTRGVLAQNLGTSAYYKAMSGEGGSGLADGVAVDVKDVDFDSIAGIAVEKCVASANPQGIDAGEYEAVLEPNAVATLLHILAMCGISGMSYYEGKSFASGRMGQLITNPKINICDDGLNADTIQMPFDYEGVPRQKVQIIKDGVMSGMIFDSASAKLAGMKSTGHAMPPGARFSNAAMHLRLSAGDSDITSMIRSTKLGIYVTRFHYVNPLHQVKTMFTGMTKDGTFMIEDGVITRPLRNLRFTDSVLNGVLKNVELISRTRQLYGSDYSIPSGYMAPAIKTAKFNFTGSTSH
jgi:PmbA protein